MFKTILTALLAGSLLLAPALAETPAKTPPKAEGRKIKTLVDYKAELGLSDAQITEIGEALKSFQVTITEQRKLLTQYEGEYSKLLADHAPLEQIKQKLRQVTDTNFNLRYADVLTSRKVEGILSAEQMSKWRAMQAKVRAAKPD